LRQIVTILEQIIKEKGIPQTFHDLADSLRKEIDEKETAKDEHQGVKGDIRSLSSSLRNKARHLENAINAILSMEGKEEQEIDLIRTKNDISDYKDFLQQLKNVLADLKVGESLSKQVENFENDLNAYEEACGNIGEATVEKEKEAQDVVDFTQRNHAIAAALLTLCREYFRQTNHDRYVEFRTKKKSNAGSADKNEMDEAGAE
jgi:uncharacterized membrane-anchored protein YjiN (DUF445 family)